MAVKIKKTTFIRSVALLVGGIGFMGLFGTDLNLPMPSGGGQGIKRRLQQHLSRSAARDLAENQDMAVGVRGPYEHGIRTLYEIKASAVAKNKAVAETSSSYFRQRTTTTTQDDDIGSSSNTNNPAFRHPFTSQEASPTQHDQHHHQQASEGPIQKIRKGLRKMMTRGDDITDQERRHLGEFNVTIVNNVTNETAVECRFTATMGPDQIAEVAGDKKFTNTIVVGYPGPDKRTVLRQMEAMTGLSGRDAWDFQFLGMTSQPFIKTNYPHHEGIWGWQDLADQVVLILRNPRRSIDEYHDILADIHYAKTWEEATEKIPDLFQGVIEADKYAMWRNERTMDEIGWYGWLIDYWMEDGLMRDYFDHKVTTPEHFALLREPETYTYGELQWDVNVCTDAVAEEPLPLSYDKLCATEVSKGCSPVAVLAAERLMDPERGHAENRKIGLILNETDGVKDYLIEDVAWDCLYDELIGNNPNGTSPDQSRGEGDAGTGYHDFRYRKGADERKHPLSTRMLKKLVAQLTRLITKYSAYDPETGIDWPSYQTAIDLVDILNEYRVEIQAELDATPNAVFPHAPKPHWGINPVCGPNLRSAWDFNYPGQEVTYGTSDGLPLYG